MKTLITVLLLGIAGSLHAQTSKEAQYGAYLTASKSMWERSVILAEKESGAKSFEKAVAIYGLLSNTMATQDEETFDDNLDLAVDLLKELIEKEDSGEAKAVLSSIYGLVMAYSPMKGMLYGSKSSSLMDEAMKSDPQSPLVHKLYAGSKLYTPKMWGGSPEKALEAYEKSITLYEKLDTSNSWMYLDTLMGQAMAQKKLEKDEDAIATLNKIIELEPDHNWAKSVLGSIASK